MKKNYKLIAFSAIFAFIIAFPFIFFFYPIRNVNLLVFLLVTLIFTFLIAYLYKSKDSLNSLSKQKRVSLYIFPPVFSTLAAFSIRSEQYFLLDNHLLVIIAAFLGTILGFSIIAMAFIKLMLSFAPANDLKEVKVYKVLIYSLPMLIASLFMFISFYPGAMTPDSLQQWEQAQTQEFTNWHPVMFTWTIMFLTNIWNSPGIIALFQVSLFALVTGFMGYMMERTGFKTILIWVLLIMLAISPINAIYSITIWKDVIYSISLLFFSLLLILLVRTNGAESKKLSFLILLFIGSFILVFFRHNGFPVFVITMIPVLIMYRHMWKRLLPVTLLVIAAHQIITGPVYSALEVHPSDPQEALSIPTQQIANIVVNNGEMSVEQKEYINRLMPLELWQEKYNPYAVDPIKFSWGDYDRWVIYDDWNQYFEIWAALVLQNPWLATEAFLNETSLVWQMTMPEDYKMNRYVTNIYLGNEFGLVNTVINPSFKKSALSYLEVENKFEEYLWRPAVYLFLSTLLVYIAYLRNNWRVWLLLLPVALNTAAVMVAIPAQDFRYLFSNSLFFYASLLISLMCFHPKVGLKNAKKRDN